MPGQRLYPYVGPAELRAAVRAEQAGAVLRTRDAVAAWLAARPEEEQAEPFTFVVLGDGVLRLAARRSEHVACAGGAPVLAAGEIGFVRRDGTWAVDTISNHSTGYCPDDVTSWPPVAAALDRAALHHPDAFTHAVLFRRCPGCHELNIVRDHHFACVFCDTDLPARWNAEP
ncbi:hypothetical protein [Actinacidiphila rubida]|uniref:Uncharacterized protein n=1 Tax=Actinacidiphila rubida TaxID=310780 RepID=A0A1H8MDR0_9ACTN|nr:hypothetical protein [Actinacidiphila rubida]SEO15358.1 hypothetical protein SAMN05216267_1018154 [Actinacidiphila rubida]